MGATQAHRLTGYAARHVGGVWSCAGRRR